MQYAYPAQVEQDEAGLFLATFPQVPEAATDAATQEAALRQAADALAAALGGYVHAGRAIPVPGKPCTGQSLVYLPPLIAAKLALYQAMQAQQVSNVELGRRLHLSEGAIRRLVDPDHRSHIGKVNVALEALGKRLIVAAA